MIFRTGNMQTSSVNGDLDAVVAEGVGATIWLNNGSGQFSDSGQSLGGALDFNASVGLADLNGNGRTDAFVARDGANEVWFNQQPGNGQNRPPQAVDDIYVLNGNTIGIILSHLSMF